MLKEDQPISDLGLGTSKFKEFLQLKFVSALEIKIFRSAVFRL